MGKDTKTFYWGLALLVLCSIGFGINLIDMVNGVWFCPTWQVIALIGTALGVLAGAWNIFKSLY